METSTHGNALLSKLAGAKFVVFPLKENVLDNAMFIMQNMKEYVETLKLVHIFKNMTLFILQLSIIPISLQVCIKLLLCIFYTIVQC